ncbi:FABP family protein [Dietzia sp. 111N12-1]|uniref:FABP family protein n=1 Tax=Dietzia sp. 111N12-1 TaxID=1785156 RepID=UPI000805E7CA|nr:FABP family protein [Dietzia sp. 111N12-1]OAV77064.1 fatty acid-binding-like protein [Dietzia sp. 111N12-1]
MYPASTPAANLTPVAALLGTWRGEGAGSYPTIDDFTYTEEITFTDVGKPFLHYVQRTWSPTGSPMHTETGYLRVPGDGTAEFVLSQPTGQTELCEGTLAAEADALVLEFRSRVHNSASAKQVDTTHRRYETVDDRITTTFAMAAVGQPLTHHLRSELRRA